MYIESNKYVCSFGGLSKNTNMTATKMCESKESSNECREAITSQKPQYHCIKNINDNDPNDKVNLAALAKCESQEDACGSVRNIDVSESAPLNIKTEPLDGDGLCVYSIYTRSPTNSSDFFTQSEFGFIIKV